MKAPRIEVKNLKVRRAGHLVLEADALDFAPGCRVAILGGNGAGKTTLLHAIAGLQDLAAGEIGFDGQIVHQGRAPASRTQRARLGLALQDPYMLAGTVAHNVAFGLRCHGVARQERRRRVAEALTRLGISALSGRRAAELSGGEQKLVSLAQILALAPPVLLLDEPTAGLDAEACELLEQVLLELSKQGHSLIVASHDSMWTQALGATEVVLQAGRLVRAPDAVQAPQPPKKPAAELPPPPVD